MLAIAFSQRTFVCLLTLALIVETTSAQTPLLRGATTTTQSRTSSRGFVPRHERVAALPYASQRYASRSTTMRASSPQSPSHNSIQATVLAEPAAELEVLEADPTMEVIPEDAWEYDSAHLVGDPESCACDSCAPAPGWGPEVVPGFWVDHLSILGGVHGFKNQSNRGEDGSFGFHTGFNYGTPAKNILLPPSVGLQIGFQANFSNFEGASFSPTDREQFFLTTGVFRRGDYGLQGGIVFDYLWDNWYYNVSVGQLRGELSVAMSERNTWGFWFASSVNTDTTESQLNDASLVESWETTDIYAIFYRSRLLAAGTGEGRLFGGFTGEGDGLVGAETKLPLHNGWALETDFTYLIPKEDLNRFEREAWNVAINLVWYPGSLACGSCFRYHRPLFDVANNGSMILQRVE